MSNIKIFTDSTNDLTDEILKENEISVIPIYVDFNNKLYKDGIDITTKELFEKVQECGNLPKTASPSPLDFSKAFKPYIDEGYDILFIGLSSRLSSTVQNAKISSMEFPDDRIEIIDSLNVSSGTGLLVLKAIKYVNMNYNLNQIAEIIRDTVPKVKTAFVVDTMEYLYKGGRCTAVQSLIGGVLKIKPLIHMVDGKALLWKKFRGNRARVIDSLIETIVQDKENLEKDVVTITHSLCFEDALYIKQQLEKVIDAEKIIITNAGSVISSHCGPNTVGILYISK